MKERPILFSAPMVRAILDGKKTQTRRVVKPQPAGEVLHPECVHLLSGRFGCYDREREYPCPYGVPGDRLWVKERACYWTYANGEVGGLNPVVYQDDPEWDGVLREMKNPPYTVTDAAGWWKSRSSIHMPRWASRILLEVVSVRVERVEAISEADAIAEGMTQKLCAEVFCRAAGRLKPQDAYYVRYANGSDWDGHHCWACCQREAKKHKGSENRSEDCPETDGPAYCDECRTPLQVSLTAYGIERELFLECDDGTNAKDFPAIGMDAAIAAQFAGGIGDLRDEHLGRLAQVGYATLWDEINGKGAWAANPWVWVVEFKVLGGGK